MFAFQWLRFRCGDVSDMFRPEFQIVKELLLDIYKRRRPYHLWHGRSFRLVDPFLLCPLLKAYELHVRTWRDLAFVVAFILDFYDRRIREGGDDLLSL